MNLDFQAFMVFALILTGLVWAYDVWFRAPRRREAAAALGADASEETRARTLKEPYFTELSRSFFPIILVVLILRSFVLEPFRIPSASMMPTLLIGDFILVNKYAYGLRLPLLGTKIVDVDEPRRGEVVVFRYPNDPSVDYIKRVVGLPGDRISYFNDRLYINGELIAQQPRGVYAGVGAGLMMSGASIRDEHLGDVDHKILVISSRHSGEGEFVVPPGQYFVMGDNRDNSNDSRFWGTVPEENLVGRAVIIWMNWDAKAGGITWSRIGNRIY